MTSTPATFPTLLLTAKQAAQALTISERTLWSLTSSGEIPSVRIGRSVRYSLADLERWIEGRKAAAPSARPA